jgi:hypothetical protein
MENKYFLYLYYQKSELALFRLYDSEKETLYYGNKQIKLKNYKINLNNFLKEINKNYLIQISKENFLTFLYFNFSKLKYKSKLELYNLIGLEEYAI